MHVMDIDCTTEAIRSTAWEPLAGAALLDRLRYTGRPRPIADAERTQRLREQFDEGLAGLPTVRVSGRPLVVTKDRLTRALAQDHQPIGLWSNERTPTVALACGAVIDVLFRQLVVTGIIDDPMADALAALAVDDRGAAMASWIEQLPQAERTELTAEVDRQVDGLRRRWPVLDPSWLPRTQQVLRVRLGDGAVDLSARVDLMIGVPDDAVSSMAFVDVRSGARRPEHRHDLHFAALIEALRSPTPPFVVATYYTRTGELDVEPVTEDLLMGAAVRTLQGIGLLSEQAVEHPVSVSSIRPPARYAPSVVEGPQQLGTPAGASPRRMDQPSDRRVA